MRSQTGNGVMADNGPAYDVRVEHAAQQARAGMLEPILLTGITHQRGHVVPSRHEAMYRAATDGPGRAGHEDPHRRSRFPTHTARTAEAGGSSVISGTT